MKNTILAQVLTQSARARRELSQKIFEWIMTIQGVSKSFTTLKAYINLFRGHVQCFELSKCTKTPRFTWDSYGSM
jgi:hypothetical protein